MLGFAREGWCVLQYIEELIAIAERGAVRLISVRCLVRLPPVMKIM
jgi:hypothetical protein